MAAFSGLTANSTGASASGRVTRAIATASQRTGVDFSYLMGQAQMESAMNPTARSRSSSATGLYQFLDQSWLAVVNNHGSEYGMDWAANAIQKTSSGHYYVSDPQVRQQILDLRNHPETASVMAAEFASDNRAYLEQRTGRETAPVDLYLAHFLGAGGAAKFLNAMNASPDTPAASLFPAAARSNASVFYDRQGNARSLAEIRSTLSQRLSNGAQSAGASTTSIDNSASYDLPAGANVVLPADYLRIAQTKLGLGSALDDEKSTDVADPALTGTGTTSDGDQSLFNQIQSLTLGRAADTSTTTGRADTARLAYLMLATLGR